nr:mechanosensitive ion channel [Planctomycetota bacterium]
RRTLLLCQIDEARSRSTALEAERETYEARRELLPLRRDRALRRQTAADKTVAFWKKKVDTRRAAEGDAAAKQAGQQLKEIDARFPVLAELAKSNKELTEMRSGVEGLPKRISLAQSEVLETEELLAETDRRYKAARRRIAVGGLTEGMGLILRRDYEWLLRVGGPRSRAEERQKKLSTAQLELIAIEEERFQVGGLDAALVQLLAKLKLDEPSEELVAAAKELLGVRQVAQDKVLEDLATLTAAFYSQKDLSNQLQESVRTYRSFIEKRILWVRSASLNPIESLSQLPAHVGELAKETGRSQVWSDLWRAIEDNLALCTLIGALFLGLTAGRMALQRRLTKLGTLVRSYRTDKYGYTLRAVALTLLIALPLPMLLWSLGWLLSSSSGDFGGALGTGLRESAWVWLTLRFMGGLLVEKGVGQSHFKWPVASLAAVRRELRWLEPIAVLGIFVVQTLEHQGTTAWSESIGRVCFVIVMVTLAFCLHRLFRSKSGFWASEPKTGKGLLGKTHRIWSISATMLPLALTLLAASGYFYTALQFELRLRYSIGFAMILVIVNALLLRWLFMARRRLAVGQAIDQRARRAEEQNAAGSAELVSAPFDDEKVDIPNVDAHTRQLFKSSLTLATVVGLYLIWASVLPALQGLDRVRLLPTPGIVEAESDFAGVEVVSSGIEEPPAHQASASPSMPLMAPRMSMDEPADSEGGDGLPQILTLADLLLALVFLALTSVAARNLPALLELALLQRLPLDSGSRYAVSTIVRYLILIAGVMAISGALGIGWQKVQWLAAALTFGLAFGLQEIFANFVSGIIILIERPIRVGDIVTVGETEGRVTQLRMRATTIQDRSRRELLIPNKEFITGTVINWTLTDPVTRIILPVGIAYGPDTKKARSLLLEAARKSKLVLDVPPPSAILRRFGD